MTLRELVKQLKTSGTEVKFFERKDRGIVITKVGDMNFKGKKGNAYVRSLFGEKLTKRQETQLSRLTRENLNTFGKTIRTQEGEYKRVFGKGTKTHRLESLPDDLKKEIAKAQRLFRKYNPKDRVTVRTKSIRYILNTEGHEEAMRRLKQAEKYAQGLVYTENLIALKQRLKHDISTEEDPQELESIEEIIKDLDNLINNDGLGFKEDQLSEMLQYVYEWENNPEFTGKTLLARWRTIYTK